jgi:hypothetical protein
MAKQKVFRSKKLVWCDQYVDLVIDKPEGDPYVCPEGLADFVEIPETAKRFWLEGSTRQWPNGSGAQVVVRRQGGSVYYYNGVDWEALFWALEDDLIEKFDWSSNETMTLYFRLLYEE